MFGDRQAEPEGVDLLEGVGADHVAGNLAGNRHERNRIQLGISDGCEQVGGAGPEVARHTAGRPVTRAIPCAMNPAPCS